MQVYRILSSNRRRAVIAQGDATGCKTSTSRFRVTVNWAVERTVERLLKSFFTFARSINVETFDDQSCLLRAP